MGAYAAPKGPLGPLPIDSDIDLLVDYDVHAHGAQTLIRLRRELSELLDERVDIATIDLLRPEVAERALAEAVPL